MINLVIGMGQIGSAVSQVLADGGYEVLTMDVNSESITRKIDVMNICFGYSDSFIKDVRSYQRKFKPKVTIIYSSVPVGTTKRIKHAVHSPIEGKHPRLTGSVRMGLRWIGYNNDEDKHLAQKVWRPITVCETVPNSDWTEFLKLASTSKYGINIVWAEYMDKVSKDLGMPYDYVKDWDQSYNDLYSRLKMKGNRKYVLDAPRGEIGGHCVVPNAKLLNEDYPNQMLFNIIEMEQK